MDVVASSMMKHLLCITISAFFYFSSDTCTTSSAVLPGNTSVSVKLEFKPRTCSKGKAKMTSQICKRQIQGEVSSTK